MPKYDLAYFNIDEISGYTTTDSSTDYVPVFDTSAGVWTKKPVVNDVSAGTAGGSTLTLTSAHAGRTIRLDTAAGTTVTLPAATGTGNVFRFRVSALATSNSHIIKVANSSDVMQGFAMIADTDSLGAAYMFFSGATGDTITLNRSTTGSVTVGEYIEISDVGTNLFHVRAYLSGTGTPVTPFSATV